LPSVRQAGAKSMRGASKGSQLPSRWNGLGRCGRAKAQGRLSDAEPLYERALERREKGRRLFQIARSLNNLGPLPPPPAVTIAA